MQFNPYPVAPGAYELTWDSEDQELLQDFRSLDQEFLTNFLKYLGDRLGIEYVQHTIYDYQLIIERGKPLSAGTSEWHNDTDDRDDIDMIVMIYNVSPNINETTGMRVGFRSLNNDDEKFLNINNCTTYVARHDKKIYQHKVEHKKDSIEWRACLSVNYRGFDHLASTQGLKVD